jgi:hypothetical protein
MSKPAANRTKRRRHAWAPGIVPGGWCSRCPQCGPAGECFHPALKSGRCGDWVWYVWKGHQWRRRWLKPYDPQTPQQVYWRARLAAASKAYSQRLTQEERRACIAAGAQRKTRRRLGQSGKKTGQLYWVGEQCKPEPPAAARQASKPKP